MVEVKAQMDVKIEAMELTKRRLDFMVKTSSALQSYVEEVTGEDFAKGHRWTCGVGHSL